MSVFERLGEWISDRWESLKEAFDDGFVLGFACGAGSIVLLVAIWRLGTLIFGG